MNRLEQVVLLLGSLEDVLPGPDTWTGNLVARSAKPGPGPMQRRKCSSCDGRGTLRDRFGRPEPCTPCGATGRVSYDTYTNQRVGTESTSLVRHTVTVRCDSCWGEGRYGNGRACTYCRGSGRRTITPVALVDSAGAPAGGGGGLDLWGHAGSYHELLSALDGLHVYDVLGYRLAWRVHVRRQLARGELAAFHRLVLGCALEYVQDRMPDPILVPAGLAAAARRLRRAGAGARGRWANGHALKERDAQIRRWHGEGKAGQWIAQQVGLTPARVSQILNGRGEG